MREVGTALKWMCVQMMNFVSCAFVFFYVSAQRSLKVACRFLSVFYAIAVVLLFKEALSICLNGQILTVCLKLCSLICQMVLGCIMLSTTKPSNFRYSVSWPFGGNHSLIYYLNTSFLTKKIFVCETLKSDHSKHTKFLAFIIIFLLLHIEWHW